MNGVCGSFSIFSSAQYLITNDPDYLWTALAFPLAGLMFDFLDGRVARWRNSSSLLGQELDSLADLVSYPPYTRLILPLKDPTDFFWCRTCLVGIRRRTAHLPRHRLSYRLHLLRTGKTCEVQRHSSASSEDQRQGQVFRRHAHPVFSRFGGTSLLLG